MTNQQFVDTIVHQGAELYRDMPWRHTELNGEFDAYKILVSECMLQQTQVTRVIPKFESFTDKFPTIRSLAEAPFSDVLQYWSGLGYNRRAQYLHDASKRLKDIPRWTFEDLVACKGIGPNTACAVLVYAHNEKKSFIETNIRTVYIHYFFADSSTVSDKEIMHKIEKVNSHITDYRKWYWALMDVGSMLKGQKNGHLTKAKSYKKQSTFKGSRRELRGVILRQLLQSSRPYQDLRQECNDDRYDDVVEALVSEKIVAIHDNVLSIVR